MLPKFDAIKPEVVKEVLHKLIYGPTKDLKPEAFAETWGDGVIAAIIDTRQWLSDGGGADAGDFLMGGLFILLLLQEADVEAEKAAAEERGRKAGEALREAA